MPASTPAPPPDDRVGEGIGPEPIRELGSSDRSAFTSVMADAFARDPWIEAALGLASAPSSSGRRAAFASFMFDHNRLLGGRPLGLFDGDRLVACALVEPPTSRWRSTLGMLASLVRFVPVAVRLGTRRTALLNTYLRRTREVAPKVPHHYLAMIGVAPAEQRRGWGKRLLHEVIARAARVPTSLGLALDTENPNNVPMYLHLGFTVAATVALDGARATVMFRPHTGSTRVVDEKLGEQPSDLA